MNPMQMMGAMMNPMGFMMKQFGANPMFRQAQQMADGKTPEQIKETCKNLCKQRGIDFDQAWAQFQSQFPMG
jgi:hypothetical protein